MKTGLKSFIKYTALLCIGLLLLWLAFKGQNINELSAYMAQANYYWVVLSIVFSILAHYLRALRWNQLINTLGFKPKASTTFHAVMIGYLANLALPRMGEVTRCGVLTKTDKIPIESLIGTVILERLIDVLFLALILVICAFALFDIISDIIYTNLIEGITHKLEGNSVLLSILIVVFLVGVFLMIILFRKYSDKLKQSKIGSKVLNLLIGMKEGISSIGKLQSPLLFIAYSIGIWLLYFLSTYVCFFALEGTEQLSPLIALFILAAGGLGMSAPVQGGIGTYEVMVSQALLLFGISLGIGLTYAAIAHLAQIISIMLIGSLSLLILFLRKKNSTTPIENGSTN